MQERVCPKCGSTNINLQVVNKVTLKNKHHGVFWWICIGWWYVPFMWLVFTVPKLIIKLFGLGHKKYKTVNKEEMKAVCQSCGYSWEI